MLQSLCGLNLENGHLIGCMHVSLQIYVDLCLRFNGHFPGGGLVSRYQNVPFSIL